MIQYLTPCLTPCYLYLILLDDDLLPVLDVDTGLGGLGVETDAINGVPHSGGIGLGDSMNA